MIKYVDLSKSQQYELPFFEQEQAKEISSLENKGWSYSYVYHLIELKNIFIALKKIKYQSKEDFSKKVIDSGLPFVKTPWDSRRILEQLNALINFGLLTRDYEIEKEFFEEVSYTNELSEKDLKLFTNIYHEYFRFKEIHSWLLSPVQSDHTSFLNNVTPEELQKNSIPVFPFIINGRFNNAFIFSLDDCTDVFKIPNNNGDLMRFWDVYVKWGQELKVIEKFSLKSLDYKISNNAKSVSCVYYLNSQKPNLDLLNFIKSEYKGNNIYIPKLIFKIALKYRYAVGDIKKMIIDQALTFRNTYSLQRTSEIFLKSKENYLLPKFNGSYISHLLIQ